MKRKIPLWVLLITVILVCAVSVVVTMHFFVAPTGNYTEEMKITGMKSLNDNGADLYNRIGDHEGLGYFYTVDIHNLKSTDTLSILPHFKTMNQTSWWSCGQASVLMVLEHYGVRGDWDEESLAALRTEHDHIGTCLDQMIETLNGVSGFELVTTYDYVDDPDAINMTFFREQIAAGYPVLIGWNDWGGHWEVAIGYDTMGT